MEEAAEEVEPVNVIVRAVQGCGAARAVVRESAQCDPQAPLCVPPLHFLSQSFSGAPHPACRVPASIIAMRFADQARRRQDRALVHRPAL